MKYLILFVFFLFSIAGLSAQSAQKAGMAVYPNPVTEYIQVNDGNETLREIAVFNLVGKKLKTFEFSRGESYYVGDLPKGMYLVQLLDKNSRVVKTQKVDKR